MMKGFFQRPFLGIYIILFHKMGVVMDYSLDIKTIIIILATGHLLSGILIIAYTFGKKREASINLFLTSKFLELSAWVLILFRGQIDDVFTILLANYFLMIGTTFEIIAFLILIERYNQTLKRIYLSLIVSFIVCFNIIFLFHNMESLRVMLISIYIVALWSFPIFKLLSNKNASMLQRTFAILFSLGLLTFLIRAFAAFKIGESMTLLASNVINSVAFFSLYTVMLIGSIGFVLLAKEKADLKLLIAATYDQMTGIYNRGSFINNANAAVSLCARKERPISLLLMDLDHFKTINDTYGHQVGDIVLKEFSQKIKSQLRNYDLFGRYGGEEFLVLLPETDSNTALEIANRMRTSIENNPVNIGKGISYTISIGGVSIIPNQETSVEILFDLSDKALYQAKESGRNRVEFHKPDTMNEK